MDSIGDYIYLILLVLAGLSSLLKKKNDTTTSSKPTPTSTKKSWDDVLRDLVPIEAEETYIKEEVVPQTVTKTPEPFLNFEGNSEPTKTRNNLKSANKVDIFKSKAKAESPQTNEVANGFLTQIQFNSLDDAKRAFVYSEIFNRKY